MTELNHKQFEDFKNVILEKNNIKIDEDIINLITKLDTKIINSYPYRVSSNNTKIWLKIFLYTLNKFVITKSSTQEIYFEKDINKFYKIKIVIDIKVFNLNLKVGSFKFPFMTSYFIINTETKEQIKFNFNLNHMNWFFEKLTIQEPDLVCKRFYLYLKSYFYYIDEYIKIIKPYFDKLVEEE